MSTAAPRFIRSRLKTRQLTLLVALADEGNIHRAADVLAMTQPAASKMLRELEQLLGVPLFERLSRGVRPTEYGLALIRHARLLIESLDQAHDEIAGLKEGLAGHVRVGSITSPAVSLLPAAVSEVKARWPSLTVTVEVESSNILLDRLAQERLDIVVGRLSIEHDKLGLHYEPLAVEPVSAVVRPHHPLMQHRTLKLSQLEDVTWIVQPMGSILRHRFELMFQRASLRPPVRVVESSAPLFVTKLIESSDMVAVLATDVANYYAEHGMVKILPLAMDCRMDDYGLITRADRLLSPAAERMYSALKDAGRLMGEQSK